MKNIMICFLPFFVLFLLLSCAEEKKKNADTRVGDPYAAFKTYSDISPTDDQQAAVTKSLNQQLADNAPLLHYIKKHLSYREAKFIAAKWSTPTNLATIDKLYAGGRFLRLSNPSQFLVAKNSNADDSIKIHYHLFFSPLLFNGPSPQGTAGLAFYQQAVLREFAHNFPHRFAEHLKELSSHFAGTEVSLHLIESDFCTYSLKRQIIDIEKEDVGLVEDAMVTAFHRTIPTIDYFLKYKPICDLRDTYRHYFAQNDIDQNAINIPLILQTTPRPDLLRFTQDINPVSNKIDFWNNGFFAPAVMFFAHRSYHDAGKLELNLNYKNTSYHKWEMLLDLAPVDDKGLAIADDVFMVFPPPSATPRYYHSILGEAPCAGEEKREFQSFMNTAKLTSYDYEKSTISQEPGAAIRCYLVDHKQKEESMPTLKDMIPCYGNLRFGLNNFPEGKDLVLVSYPSSESILQVW